MSRTLSPTASSPSWLTTGPVVLGAVVTGTLGYGIGLWLARVGTYAERVEEEQYCDLPAATGS